MSKFLIAFAERGEYIAKNDPRHRRCNVTENPEGFVAENLEVFCKANRLVYAPIKISAVDRLREKLAAFKAALSSDQLGDLWYQYREPIESALADAATGDARGIAAVKRILLTLPWVAGRDDAVKAAALDIIKT